MDIKIILKVTLRYFYVKLNEVLVSELYIERQGLMLTESLKIHVVINQTAFQVDISGCYF